MRVRFASGRGCSGVRCSARDYAAGFVDTEFGTVRDGYLPGGLLADYILDARQPVRALFVIAGNPLLSVPDERRMRTAVGALELLVCIDIYPNATTEYAHWSLPATDQYERADFGLAHAGIQYQSAVHYTPRVATPQFERREEWWIYARLAQHLGLPSALDAADPDEARWKRVDRLLAQGGLDRDAVTATPHGIKLGTGLHPGRLPQLIHTADRHIDCRPASFDTAIERCETIFASLGAEPLDQLKLITRRDSRMHNSWYTNLPGMRQGRRATNRLAMNPLDAARLNVTDGQTVQVASAVGTLETTLELDESLRPGVVSMEHGWGLQSQLTQSRQSPGSNPNLLTPSGPGSFETASNQQQLTGIPVTVVAVDDQRVVRPPSTMRD